jgi:hypothetical protein
VSKLSDDRGRTVFTRENDWNGWIVPTQDQQRLLNRSDPRSSDRRRRIVAQPSIEAPCEKPK